MSTRQESSSSPRKVDPLMVPPTHAVLIKHTKMTAYQPGYCCGQIMIAAPELPPPGE